MPDVAQKCITANDIKNNSILSAIMQDGTKHVKQRGDNIVTTVANMETKYTTRWDDPTYYTN